MLSNRARLVFKTILLTLLGLGFVAGAAGVAMLFGGWYNIGATKQHFPLIYSVFQKGMHYSIQHHAREVVAPPLGAPQQVMRGAAVYRAHCAQCHGGPGAAPAPYGMSMQPVPGPLVAATSDWSNAELYWIIRHGVKMSGMPAWQPHLSEAELWAVVSFVAAMPAMTATEYARMTSAAPHGEAP